MELDKKEKRDPEHNDTQAANPLTSGATFPENRIESILRQYGRDIRIERDKIAPISDEQFAEIKERVNRLAAEKK